VEKKTFKNTVQFPCLPLWPFEFILMGVPFRPIRMSDSALNYILLQLVETGEYYLRRDVVMHKDSLVKVHN